MSKISTAEEFLNTFNRKVNDTLEQGVQEAMIEFAKLHCEAQLSAILSNATTRFIPFTDDEEVDKDSIINAYPLDNIK